MNCAACDEHKGCHVCKAKMSFVKNATATAKNRMICKNCAAIDAKCEKCTATKCLACKKTHGLKADGSCGQATGPKANDLTNCQAASLTGTAYKCIACNPRFFADASGNCKACPAGCLFCAKLRTCAICQPGTYWDKATSTCKRCPGSLTGCRMCASATKCKVCAPGHYADATTGGCKRCDRSCKDCVGPKKTDCLSCFGDGVLTTLQKKPGVEYEDADK